MKLMKCVCSLLLLLTATGQLFSDEGMWVMKELNMQNLARMAELGFVPSIDKLYSETDPWWPMLSSSLAVAVPVLPFRKPV